MFCVARSHHHAVNNVSPNSSTSDMRNVAVVKEELTFEKIHEILGREILLDFNERKKLKYVAEEPLIIL